MINQQQPVISVLMPVYNGEKYLVKAIESILKQTFKDFEFLIINDGSSDKTEEIILSYQDSRIVYIKNEENLRLIKTLNKGVDLAKGKYIARMDADDISMLNRFERQIKLFEQFPEADIINCQHFLLNEFGDLYRKDRTSVHVNSEAIRYISVIQNMITHPGVMIRSEIVKLHKYKDSQDVEHIEDFELWNRLFKAGSICYTTNEYLLYYRVNPSSINNTKGGEQSVKMNNITTEILKNQYNININNDIIKLIQGDFNRCRFDSLKKTEAFLNDYFLEIKKANLISEKGFADLLMWKKHKIFIISIKSLSKVNIVIKIEIMFFLVTKILWLGDRKWRIKLLEIINSKQTKFRYN